MAQSTILAAGTSAATSSEIVVAAGATVTVGMFVASGSLPGQPLAVMQKTPGGTIRVASLTPSRPSIAISAPGTYVVTRDNNTGGVSVGAFLES